MASAIASATRTARSLPRGSMRWTPPRRHQGRRHGPALSLARERFAEKQASGSRPRPVVRRSCLRPRGGVRIEACDGPEMAERGTTAGQTQTVALTKPELSRRRRRSQQRLLLWIDRHPEHQRGLHGCWGDKAEARPGPMLGVSALACRVLQSGRSCSSLRTALGSKHRRRCRAARRPGLLSPIGMRSGGSPTDRAPLFTPAGKKGTAVHDRSESSALGAERRPA
jgi:hypothetical protein